MCDDFVAKIEYRDERFFGAAVFSGSLVFALDSTLRLKSNSVVKGCNHMALGRGKLRTAQMGCSGYVCQCASAHPAPYTLPSIQTMASSRTGEE